jgi:hypothetical protein
VSDVKDFVTRSIRTAHFGADKSLVQAGFAAPGRSKENPYR